MKFGPALLFGCTLLFADCASALQRQVGRSAQASQRVLEQAPYTIPAHRIKEYLSDPNSYGRLGQVQYNTKDTIFITIHGTDYKLIPCDSAQ